MSRNTVYTTKFKAMPLKGDRSREISKKRKLNVFQVQPVQATVELPALDEELTLTLTKKS